MFQDITVTDLIAIKEKEPHTMIDVRSPQEFQEATIPGSINIPILNNEERAEVGTIYKQVGKEAAMDRGLAIFSQKLPAFIDEFKKIETPMTVFCWRGGMRSKTAATVLDLMGIRANRLSGGIRSFRRWIVNYLDTGEFQPELLVLNGYTGSGKTLILQKLKEKGYPVIDLEGMAGHRGSIFGQIGMTPRNQKKFDAALVTEMLKYRNDRFVFVEGESKRIGRVYIPDIIYEKKEVGLQIFIDLPLRERVKNIIEEYEPWNYPERFQEAYRYIKKKIHTPVAKQIESHLENEEFTDAVKLLLEYYYDPRYEHSASHFPESQKMTIQADSVDEAFTKVLEAIQQTKIGIK
ncbi:MAG TPA: tRNA 2-selenouridine(34) synthase MnmH [Bacillus bacterium]|uniref:tRNA 2-selenouridine synthase n=1 Tax=Siminovitchia fordii TaxID=254759 RepID=A0ABQ4K7N0_9BACI|nr:tRNA 2-selenouridine(34) synthase MnmH [Siminovitchia fordii]GIN20961.1 tRNA 2-selenouridine synthase [Siminovitchia fordii]HBZ09341.1 tRNA 2-selenouridine(34) synthase MnmH [Bacillus sp. (in: firmicutes)]